jgi:hypothetical protein
MYAFRIMTPETTQGTTLQKYGGSDSRPVMDAEILDIKNSTDTLRLSGGQLLFLVFRHFRILLRANRKAPR